MKSWWVVGPAVGTALGLIDSVVNHVPAMLGEIGTARAQRGGWSQAAEFGALILDAAWAWAAVAVLAGWLVSRHARAGSGLSRGALTGGVALVFATAVYYGVDLLFDGGVWWDGRTRFWLLGSVVFGPVFGLVGALVRRPAAVGVVASLVVPAGAALQMAVLPPTSDSRMGDPVRFSIWLAALVAVVLIAGRIRRRHAVAGAEAQT